MLARSTITVARARPALVPARVCALTSVSRLPRRHVAPAVSSSEASALVWAEGDHSQTASAGREILQIVNDIPTDDVLRKIVSATSVLSALRMSRSLLATAVSNARTAGAETQQQLKDNLEKLQSLCERIVNLPGDSDPNALNMQPTGEAEEGSDAADSHDINRYLNGVRELVIFLHELLTSDLAKAVLPERTSTELDELAAVLKAHKENKDYQAGYSDETVVALLAKQLRSKDEILPAIILLDRMLQAQLQAVGHIYSTLKAAGTTNFSAPLLDEPTYGIIGGESGTGRHLMNWAGGQPDNLDGTGNLSYVRQKVYFATNRNPELLADTTSFDKAFGTNDLETLSYGAATVTIPQDDLKHDSDAQKRPDIVPPGNPEYVEFQVNIVGLKRFGQDEAGMDGMSPARKKFLEEIRRALNASEDNELVLFIHGYNVGWADAIKSTGQLTMHSSQHSGKKRVALAFDWASCASTTSYAFVPWEDDLERAEQAAPMLAQLLSDLSNYVTDCKAIHVVAHSMGKHVLQKALLPQHAARAAVGDAAPVANGVVPNPVAAAGGFFARIRSFIFAAPDADRNLLTELLAELHSFYAGLQEESRPRSYNLYCSSKDVPLAVSTAIRWLHDRQGRAGFFKNPAGYRRLLGLHDHYVHPFLHPHVETIDVTGHAADMLGHGYYNNDEIVVQDISAIMSGGPRKLRDTAASESCNACRVQLNNNRGSLKMIIP